MPFKRTASLQLIQSLRNEPLFNNCLLPDIKAGKVFPAIRIDRISFYYGGGSLFWYDAHGFSTYIKYAFAPENPAQQYVTEAELGSVKHLQDFVSGYTQIKENCALYAGVEAKGVSELFKFSPYAGTQSRYYLLDIEVVFGSLSNVGKATDRIDLLFYDTADQMLIFGEAKHFSNGEIWATAGNLPRVITQLNSYRAQIAHNKSDIVREYANAFGILGQIFGVSLGTPKKVYPECGLIIFGFDSNQKAKIQKLLIDDGSLNGCKHYEIGGIGNIVLNNAMKKITK